MHPDQKGTQMKIQRLSGATITDIVVEDPEILLSANVTYAGKTRRVEFSRIDGDPPYWRAYAVFAATVGRGKTAHPLSLMVGQDANGDWRASLPHVVVRNRQATVRGWMEDWKTNLADYYGDL